MSLCDAASDWLEQTRNIMYWPQVLARSDLHCTSSARWKSHKYNKVKNKCDLGLSLVQTAHFNPVDFVLDGYGVMVY